MTAPAPVTHSAISDARLMAKLLGIDPLGLGGVVLRGASGPCRDDCVALIRQQLPPGRPWRKVPLHIDDDRLLGGLDVAASLSSGTLVVASGLLAEADGGAILLPMAERLQRGTAARICAVMDRGEVLVERNGFSRLLPARFSVIALDEGLDEDEMLSADLADRLAFHLDLQALAAGELDAESAASPDLNPARDLLPKVAVPQAVMESLGMVALALGVTSLRSTLLALRACRVSAALNGRESAEEEDVLAAIRLVLAPRALQWPVDEANPAEQQPGQQPEQQTGQQAEPPQAEQGEDRHEQQSPADGIPEDLVLAAIKAAMPADMLARLQASVRRTVARGSRARGGANAQSRHRGRPLGVRQATPVSGQRLNLAATLKAAAPWQGIRRKEAATLTPDHGRIRVRPEDFHITRFKARRETTTIFVVDASGSAAAQRLAEAKGAVELLLAQCYVRRDQVAVIAFRGSRADLLLPPTRALARAKRELAALPGGGGTPLATGIDAARELATELQRKGQTPVVVMMTDGRANICRDGSPGHERANEEALAAARLFRAAEWSSVIVDTANRPRSWAKSVANAMGAQYFPLPYAQADVLSDVIRTATSAK